MTERLETIAIGAIDAQALIRDRTSLEPEALEELETSILRHGLRMPVEVYAIEGPAGGTAWGLIPACGG